MQKFLIDNGLVLHSYKIHYSQSSLNIWLYYFIPTTFKTNKKITNLIQNPNNFNEKILIKKFICGLQLFTKKKYQIITTFHCINKTINFLTPKQINFIKKKLILLRRYKNDDFNFDETFNLLFYAIVNKNSSFIISNFIANKLKTIKKHNRFLKCVKKILILLVKSDMSMIKSIRIKISGKINRARRTKNKVITIGDMPIQTISADIGYSQESKTHNPNGSLGIKVWIIDK